MDSLSIVSSLHMVVCRQGLMSKVFRDEQKEKSVRPGQLLTCISAMHDELMVTDTNRADPNKVERLELIQQEALQALTDIVEKP